MMRRDLKRKRRLFIPRPSTKVSVISKFLRNAFRPAAGLCLLLAIFYTKDHLSNFPGFFTGWSCVSVRVLNLFQILCLTKANDEKTPPGQPEPPNLSTQKQNKIIVFSSQENGFYTITSPVTPSLTSVRYRQMVYHVESNRFTITSIHRLEPLTCYVMKLPHLCWLWWPFSFPPPNAVMISDFRRILRSP